MNLILVTVDCLRPDYLSCYGHNKKTSPTIDSLAEGGTMFTQAIINGVGTAASFPSMLTSTYPLQSGSYSLQGRKTIAEVLQKRGYETAGFNHNAFLSPAFGYNRGFDYYYNSKPNKWVKRGLNLFGQYQMDSPSLSEEVFGWLTDHHKDQFFLWIHYMDVHGPHYIPKGFCKETMGYCILKAEQEAVNFLLKNSFLEGKDLSSLKAIYNAEIRYVDDYIKDLLTMLSIVKVLDKTTVIVTADHGEEFFEHGKYHSHTQFYDEMLRVPLIINGPDIPIRKTGKQVSLLDLAPTILDILDEGNEEKFIGTSLLTEKNTEDNLVFTEVDQGYKLGSREGPLLRKDSVRFSSTDDIWKYIRDSKTYKEEFYNITEDPSEETNLINSEDFSAIEVLRFLRRELSKHVKSEEQQEGPLHLSRKEEKQVKKRLSELGYL